MRHLGSEVTALRAKFGTAARLTVDESHTRFTRWKAFSRAAVAQSDGLNAGLRSTRM
jgi:hypothetical protein